MNQTLINFYFGKQRDNKGRSLSDILAFHASDLEKVHDYIQFLFPLTAASRFNPDAPLLDEETITVMRDNRMIQNNLRMSLGVMLKFYDFESARQKHAHWLTPSNHNYMRLSRILQSLMLLGMEDEAKIILSFLDELYEYYPDEIGDVTLDYWHDAVSGDLITEYLKQYEAASNATEPA